MSQSTLELLGRSPGRVSAGRVAAISELTDRLVACYGNPSLGNFRDPVKEIFYIVLSARTSEALYQRAFRRLFARFPRLDLLANASLRQVRGCVAVAGFGFKRARQVLAIARKLVADFGNGAGRQLRKMSAAEAYSYLTHLPGIGPKSALCVMMCSLDADVFPVDANVQRVLARVGILKAGLKHYQAQNLAPRYVPSGRCKELHVGLIELGRKVCLPARPRCAECVLNDMCRHGRREKG